MNREMFAPLTERYLAGDRRALEQLLLLSYRPVSCLCRKLLLNSAEADRITREVLVRICTLPESLPEPEQFEAWLRRFAAVRCVQTAALLPPEELKAQDSNHKEWEAEAARIHRERATQRQQEEKKQQEAVARKYTVHMSDHALIT